MAPGPTLLVPLSHTCAQPHTHTNTGSSISQRHRHTNSHTSLHAWTTHTYSRITDMQIHIGTYKQAHPEIYTPRSRDTHTHRSQHSQPCKSSLVHPHTCTLRGTHKDTPTGTCAFAHKQACHSHHRVTGVLTQSCLTLCDPMDCGPLGSSVPRILQARILEWVAFPSPGDLPDPGIEPESPELTGRFFTTAPAGKPRNDWQPFT